MNDENNDNNVGDEDTLILEEDKTSGKNNEEDDNGEDKKNKNSEINQKIKYREKFLSLKEESLSKIAKLEAELAELRSLVKKPTDDAEARAQDYIRSQAKQVFDELQSAKKSEEDRMARQLKDEVESILDDNPDISEEELLDTIEEYEVSPKVALKILKKQSTSKTKPKMPQSKRGSTSAEPTGDKPDDSKKSIWQILQEEKASLNNKS